MTVRGPSRAGRPCRQGRTITKARPPPPPRARAQASTPRACRVSRSHTPCPCYPPSHHLTLPTPSNYKSCQGAPLPGRASHRAPARTTLQPLVTAHCHTGLGPWVGLGPCTTPRRMRAVCLHASRQCGPYVTGQQAGLRAAGGNVTVECEMQVAVWGMANGRRMRR